jgi:hypothetical protein
MNSKEVNSSDFYLDFVPEFGLWGLVCNLYTRESSPLGRLTEIISMVNPILKHPASFYSFS